MPLEPTGVLGVVHDLDEHVGHVGLGAGYLGDLPDRRARENQHLLGEVVPPPVRSVECGDPGLTRVVHPFSVELTHDLRVRRIF